MFDNVQILAFSSLCVFSSFGKLLLSTPMALSQGRAAQGLLESTFPTWSVWAFSSPWGDPKPRADGSITGWEKIQDVTHAPELPVGSGWAHPLRHPAWSHIFARTPLPALLITKEAFSKSLAHESPSQSLFLDFPMLRHRSSHTTFASHQECLLLEARFRAPLCSGLCSNIISSVRLSLTSLPKIDPLRQFLSLTLLYNTYHYLTAYILFIVFLLH